MRNVSADFLRIMCCILVIAIHVTPDYATMVRTNQSDLVVYQSLLIQSFVRAGLPIFFIMSGYFLLNRKSENLIDGYRKRFATLLIPFFIYAFLNYAYQHSDAFNKHGISGFIDMLYKSPTAISVHLWFVYSLLGIYIIYPAIKVVTDAIPKDKTVPAIIFIAVVCCWPQYEHQLGKIINGYHNIIPIPQLYIWLGYFIIGGLLFRVNITRSACWKLFLASSILQLANTWISVNGINFDTKPYDFSISMFFFASMLTLIITRTKFNSEGKLYKAIAFISPFTYGIYLIHISVREWLNTQFNIPPVVECVALKTIAYVFCIFVLSLAISFVVDRAIVNRLVSFARHEKKGSLKNA